MSGVRTLTSRELNRALLARQMLLERARVTIPRALERMGGLQAQYAPAMYVGLWSRVADLPRDAVTAALQERKAVQGTLLRCTIHLVSTQDYWPFALGVRGPRRDWYLRVTKDPPGRAALTRAAEALRAALRDGPIRQADIDAIVGPTVRSGVGLWLDLVRVPPSGTWERRRADLYGLAEEWVGAEPARSEASAVELLAKRYLGGFGPAASADIARWMGVPAATVAPALDGMALRRFRDEAGTELVDLPRAPLPDAETPAPVRFLPTWDATLLVHARRSGILPEAYRPRIFHTKMPQSIGTFLVDGAVAGTWKYRDGRVTVEEFHPLSAADRRAVAAEADRLADFHR